MKRSCGHGRFVNGCLSCFERLGEIKDRFEDLLDAVRKAANDAEWDEDEAKPMEW